MSEERSKDEVTSGQFDLYGKIIDEEEGVLGDLKGYVELQDDEGVGDL